MPITTKVSSNPIHGEMYSIQQYVIKFVSDLRLVSVFSPGTPVSIANKTDRHDITDKGNNKITELWTILQRESQNS